MRVGRRRGEVAMAGESLGQEKIPGRPIKIGDGAVAKRMKTHFVPLKFQEGFIGTK